MLDKWSKQWLREMLKTKEDIQEALVILLCEIDKQEMAGKILTAHAADQHAFFVRVMFPIDQIAAAAAAGSLKDMIQGRTVQMMKQALKHLEEKGYSDGE